PGRRPVPDDNVDGARCALRSRRPRPDARGAPPGLPRNTREGEPTHGVTADFKNGLVLKDDGNLLQIVEFQHVKPGKGPAFVRTKLKNVVSGKTIDKTYSAGTKVETATVDR